MRGCSVIGKGTNVMYVSASAIFSIFFPFPLCFVSARAGGGSRRRVQ